MTFTWPHLETLDSLFYWYVIASDQVYTVSSSDSFKINYLIHEEEDTLTVLPMDYIFYQPGPNPIIAGYSPITFKFEIPEPSDIKMIIYDIRGYKIAEMNNLGVGAGFHEYHWNVLNYQNKRISSGLYFVTFEANSFFDTKKFIYIK